MKKTSLYRLLTVLLALMLTAALFACGSSEEAETPAPDAQQNEPQSDEVDVSGQGSQNAQEDPQQPSGEDGRIALNVPADGEYSVSLQRDVLIDSNGRTYVKAKQILYAELDSQTIDALQTGDTVTLPNGYEFVVEMMRKTEENVGKAILFNEGLERCVYIPETDTWRFTWPSEVPYTYEGELYVVPEAIDVTLIDDYTPLAMGESVYGVPYDESDDTIGILDEIGDYFSYHSYLENERATMTVQNGEIVSIVIDFHE